MIKSGFCYVFGIDRIEESLEHLAKCGFEGVEFWHNDLKKIDKKYLKRLLDKNKISCAQICPYFDFTGSRNDWEKSIKLGEEYIEWSKILGNPLIRVFTGKVGSRQATKKQFMSAVKGLQILCDNSKKYNIRFALETHENSLMETSESTLNLLKAINRRNIGVNLQIPLKGEDIWYSLEKLGKYTIHMHAHNWSGKVGGLEMTFLNSGVIDFELFLKKMLEKGFDGCISIEHPDHLGKHDPKIVAEVEGSYLQCLKKKLK